MTGYTKTKLFKQMKYYNWLDKYVEFSNSQKKIHDWECSEDGCIKLFKHVPVFWQDSLKGTDNTITYQND